MTWFLSWMQVYTNWIKHTILPCIKGSEKIFFCRIWLYFHTSNAPRGSFFLLDTSLYSWPPPICSLKYSLESTICWSILRLVLFSSTSNILIVLLLPVIVNKDYKGKNQITVNNHLYWLPVTVNKNKDYKDYFLEQFSLGVLPFWDFTGGILPQKRGHVS
jgi:hypothetical protein